MFTRMLFVLLLLSLPISAAAAQEASPAPEGVQRLPFVISTVEPLHEASGLMGVHITGALPTGCAELPVQITQRNTQEEIVLTLAQLADPMQICPAMLVMVDEIVWLAQPITKPITLYVNGLAVPAEDAQPVQAPADYTPSFAPELPTDANRVPLAINSAQASATQTEAGLAVTVQADASLTSGCASLPIEIVQTIRPEGVKITLSEIGIGLYACPPSRVPYPASIPLYGTFAAMPTVTLNDTPAAAGASMAGERSPLIIDSATPTITATTPARISLAVSAMLRNGCAGMPVEITQRRAGSAVTIDIVQIIAPDVMCPAMLTPYPLTIALDGTFEPGSYTVTLNDFVLDPIRIGGS
jgi:hypothetical protein